MRLALAFIPLLAFAADSDHPTGTRITPPILASVAPLGVARGTTTELTIDGQNLARASAIYFDQKGVTGKILRVKELPDLTEVRLGSNGTASTIDLGPIPPRHQVTVEVDVSPDAEIGPVAFRLLTPLGTSPEGRFLIEPYYGESVDREPNDTVENAVEALLPTILTGAISRSGDIDMFRIQAGAGEEIVFLNGAAGIGSSLQAVVTILDAGYNELLRLGGDGTQEANLFSHRFEKAGVYYVRVSDYLQSGRGGHFYRIVAGKFAAVTGVAPLGIRKGESREVKLTGFNLKSKTVKVTGAADSNQEDLLTLRPAGLDGLAFNSRKLAVGDSDEIDASGANHAAASAQRVSLPVVINGRIGAPVRGVGVVDYYRFTATKGQSLVMEVTARRLGSDLDSIIEVLDTSGNPIERALARPVWETSLVLRDHDSAQRGLRLHSYNVLNVGDYMMIGSEIVRVDTLPKGPDEDTQFDGYNGQRVSYFDTTSEAHAVDKSIYKVQMYPPETKLTSNGMPLLRIFYRNDDGSGPGFSKDSRLTFTAPSTGDYLLRIRDVQGQGGDTFGYRLSIRPPQPDFRLTLTPRNPNVPAGGTIPLSVLALRTDEFDGPIDVEVTGLPRGFTATKATIGAGQRTATLLLTADADAALDRAVPFEVAGSARVGGVLRTHRANTDDSLKLLATMPKADVMTFADSKEVILEPGGSAQVSLHIERNNGFGGRVPIEVLNLPPRVIVTDVGLNGVLVNEDEKARSFTLQALANAEPVEQVIYVSGRVETRSGQQNSFAATQAIRVKVLPKKTDLSKAATGAPASSANQR